MQSAEIKKAIEKLQSEKSDVEETLREKGALRHLLIREILRLQGECPHEHTKEGLKQDVAKMKPCAICADCGTQIRRDYTDKKTTRL